jgi:dipeptidyl aminopeptidase/acylaminoacyl peptidase
VLTVADVLAIRHPEAPLRWSPDGKRLAFAYLVDGVRELWVAEATAAATRASREGQAVGAYGWTASGELLHVVGNEVWRARQDAPWVSGLEPSPR